MKTLSFGVRKEKEAELAMNMRRLGVLEEHLEETFMFSGKKGGQNANRTATKVRIKHLPTGIMVTCAKERFQRLNRFLARRLLLEKLELYYKERQIRGNVEESGFKKTDLVPSPRLEKIRKQKVKRKKKSAKKYHEK